ncbi:MAG: glycosyltransferase family 4 protein [Candidatus Hodarchaeota archaeon]
MELAKRVEKLIIFYVQGEIGKNTPKNVIFIKIKAPTRIPRFLRCLFLIFFKSIYIVGKVKNQGIDALYILSGFWDQNIFLVVSKIARKPFIVRLRGEEWRVRRLSKYWRTLLPLMKLYDTIEKFALNQANQIICIHKFLEEEAIAHGVKKEKIVTVHHGVSSDLFKPSRKEQIKKKFTVCCVSRLVREKRIEFLLKAVKNLNVEVIVIGSGKEEYVENLKKKAPINVKFFGYVEHEKLPEYINYADIVVSPRNFGARARAWERNLLEAMSCGKPVIAAVSARAYSAIGFKGWPIKSNEVEGLRRAIIEASQTPKEVLEEMGRANREIILKEFNWGITYTKILRIIESYC